MPFDFCAYSTILLDLDGTLCHDDHPLPGAADFIRAMRDAGKTIGVISNSASGPLRVQMRLHSMGISVDAGCIYTCAAHAADTVLERFSAGNLRRRPRAFNLSSHSIDEMLDGKVDWVQTGGEPCDCVLVGAPTTGRYSEERARTALQLVRNGAQIIGLCADRLFPSKRGLEFGSGALTSMLAYASASTPIYCGKPQPEFFLHLCQRLDAGPESCVLVGDNLESDIAGAMRVGIRGILTLTGVSRRRDTLQLDEAARPICVVEDLSELL